MLALLALPAAAQTVRPLINELGNPAHGRVEYFNDANVPLNVVVDVRSFTVSERGELSYAPLDPGVHIKLSATSFRVGPKQSYYLFYEATSDHAPAWFVIYANFSGFGLRTANGMNVRLQLPHTVYLLPKGGLEKADVRINRAEYDPASKKLLVEAENLGSSFGRVEESWLSAGRKKQEGSGFPIFPHSKRIMEYSWQGEGSPSRVELQFERFHLDRDTSQSGGSR